MLHQRFLVVAQEFLYFAFSFPRPRLHNGIDPGSFTTVIKSKPFIVKTTTLGIFESHLSWIYCSTNETFSVVQQGIKE